MTQNEAIVYQAAHLFSRTELAPGFDLPGLRTEEQAESILEQSITGFRQYTGGVLSKVGRFDVVENVPNRLLLTVAEADIARPAVAQQGGQVAGSISEEELQAEGESADDYSYSDAPVDAEALQTVSVADVLRSRAILEPLLAGTDNGDDELFATETAIIQEAWMAQGDSLFKLLDPRHTKSGVPENVFTRLATHLKLPHEDLAYTGDYNPHVTDLMIAAKASFTGALGYLGIIFSGEMRRGVDLEHEAATLKAMHRAYFNLSLQNHAYDGNVRQFAMTFPLSKKNFAKTVQILTSRD